MKQPPLMKLYTIKDYTGAQSTHLAVSAESAVQAHMMHHGLLYLRGRVEVLKVEELIDIEDRSTICWEPRCCMMGTIEYDQGKSEITRKDTYS